MTHSTLDKNDPRIEAVASCVRGTEVPGTFKNVLVGVDGSSTGRDAIALAEKLCDAESRLTLAHVMLVQQPVYGNFHSSEAGKKARKMLESERAAAGVSAVLTGMFASSVSSGLHRLAADTRRRPAGRRLLRSPADRAAAPRR